MGDFVFAVELGWATWSVVMTVLVIRLWLKQKALDSFVDAMHTDLETVEVDVVRLKKRPEDRTREALLIPPLVRETTVDTPSTGRHARID